MARYIDADALKRLRDDVINGRLDILIEGDLIDACPTADVAVVKHGEWKHTDYAEHWRGKDECSLCGYHFTPRLDLSCFNYCPNCGAKMDGTQEERGIE